MSASLVRVIIWSPILGLILCSAASAASITHSESGDYPGDPASSSAPSFALQVGDNIFTGAVNGWPGFPLSLIPPFGDDADAFNLTLPAGLVISSASIAINNFTYGDGYILPVNGSLTEITGTTFISGDGTTNLTNNLPSADPSFSVTITSSGGLGIPGGIPAAFSPDGLPGGGGTGELAGGFTYSLLYTVTDSASGNPTLAPLPLPAAFPAALPLLALPALIHLRRRKH